MDCNGQHFRMISRKADFESLDSCVWDEKQGRLRLDSRRVVDFPGEREELPFLPGATHDRYGTWAWVAPDFSKALMAGAFPTPEALFEADSGREIVDLAHGEDDVLYLLLGTRGGQTDVALLDRRERWRQQDEEGNWQLFTLHTDDFDPDVVKPAPGGGAYFLDRARKTLGILRGLPLSAGGPLFGVTFRPVEEDADPPRLRLFPSPVCDDETRVAAFAASPDGRLAFLLWPDDPLQPAAISIWKDDTCEIPPAPLAGCFAPFDIGWLGQEMLGVLVSGHPEAIAFSVSELASPGETLPEGERYPLAESAERRFFNSLSLPVSWPMTKGVGIRPRPLHPLSLSAVSRTGSAVAKVFDSRAPETEWHRLYLEAVIPRGTQVRLVLTAADDLAGLETAPEAVHLAGGKADGSGYPTAAWLPERSEIPYHQGLLGLEPQRPYVGLYTVLVQRTGTVVRSVRGRFLQVRVELEGGGAATPAIAAIRVYAPRFSYLDRYLPEHYRETMYGADADTEGAATGSDFLKRFLGLFESFLTPLEDRIAASYLLTLPETAPAADLDRLSSWIGLTLLPGLPLERKRRMLKQATNIQRMHGTLPGLKLALNCVTGGMVTRGDVVIVEDFIFRRVFATILGIELGGEYDPLLAGVAVSGNSFIGKTLVLGDEEKREFLSLFRVGDHVTDSEDTEQIADFFDLPAFRATVLVHHDVDDRDVGFIRRTVETEVPAHVAARVISASKPLLVGLTGLIGIESYIEERPPMPPVKLGDYTIGRGGVITSFGALDGRFGA